MRSTTCLPGPACSCSCSSRCGAAGARVWGTTEKVGLVCGVWMPLEVASATAWGHGHTWGAHCCRRGSVLAATQAHAPPNRVPCARTCTAVLSSTTSPPLLFASAGLANPRCHCAVHAQRPMFAEASAEVEASPRRAAAPGASVVVGAAAARAAVAWRRAAPAARPSAPSCCSAHNTDAQCLSMVLPRPAGVLGLSDVRVTVRGVSELYAGALSKS